MGLFDEFVETFANEKVFVVDGIEGRLRLIRTPIDVRCVELCDCVADRYQSFDDTCCSFVGVHSASPRQEARKRGERIWRDLAHAPHFLFHLVRRTLAVTNREGK